MSDSKIYDVPASFAARGLIDETTYQAMYQQSVDDPERFWAEQAKKFLTWSAPWTHVSSGNFRDANIRWFEGAKLNVSVNCLDRHLATRGEHRHCRFGNHRHVNTDAVAFFHAARFERVGEFADGDM